MPWFLLEIDLESSQAFSVLRKPTGDSDVHHCLRITMLEILNVSYSVYSQFPVAEKSFINISPLLLANLMQYIIILNQHMLTMKY